MSNWLDMLNNPRSHTLKKAMFEILKERYAPHDTILERVSNSLTTEQDFNQFYKLVTDIYEAAYFKAVVDHQEQLKKVGLTARVVKPT